MKTTDEQLRRRVREAISFEYASESGMIETLEDDLESFIVALFQSERKALLEWVDETVIGKNDPTWREAKQENGVMWTNGRNELRAEMRKRLADKCPCRDRFAYESRCGDCLKTEQK